MSLKDLRSTPEEGAIRGSVIHDFFVPPTRRTQSGHDSSAEKSPALQADIDYTNRVLPDNGSADSQDFPKILRLRKPAHKSRWPETCRYYEPQTTNPEDIRDLMWHDSEYFEPQSNLENRLHSIDIADGRATLESAPLSTVSLDTRLQVRPDGIASTKIFFIPQKRQYRHHHSTNKIHLHSQVWEEVLDRLSVLPSFLELLHSNNGGMSCHISYCGKNGTGSDCGSSCTEDSISAFHIGIKIGDWGNYEYAVYARHDFHTGHDLILTLGTNTQNLVESLTARLESAVHLDMFQILLHLASSWLNQLERVRWDMDFATQDLEARTGFTSLRGFGVEPLPAEQLAFTQGLQVTADYLQNVAFGSARVGEAFLFLKDQLLKFTELRNERANNHLPRSWASPLQSAFMQKHSLAYCQRQQIQRLCDRVQAQLEVTKTLIAQRDTQVNIEIAKAAKRDSELMKGITVVTMVFLPATFMATFFSMVFWHVGGEKEIHLLVSGWIWLYPAVTLPLTVIVLTWYLAYSWDWSRVLLGRSALAAWKRRN